KNANVKVVCTTDDPADDLHYHELLAEEEKDFKVLPAFRPDKALNANKEDFGAWIKHLSEACGHEITSYTELIAALGDRVDYFHAHGGRLSDHAFDILRYVEADEEQLENIFQKALKNDALTDDEIDAYRTETMSRLIHFYHD